MGSVNLRKLWLTLVHIAYDIVLKLNPRKLAAHAAIFDEQGRLLILESRYAGGWALPGGGLDRREHLDAAVVRECREELGVEVEVEYLTGLYYHQDISAYVAVFRCRMADGSIRLSHEHTRFRWAETAVLPARLRICAEDAQARGGSVAIRTFA